MESRHGRKQKPVRSKARHGFTAVAAIDRGNGQKGSGNGGHKHAADVQFHAVRRDPEKPEVANGVNPPTTSIGGVPDCPGERLQSQVRAEDDQRRNIPSVIGHPKCWTGDDGTDQRMKAGLRNEFLDGRVMDESPSGERKAMCDFHEELTNLLDKITDVLLERLKRLDEITRMQEWLLDRYSKALLEKAIHGELEKAELEMARSRRYNGGGIAPGILDGSVKAKSAGRPR
jgi:hypothetical protein